jgi:uncharacterized protein with HEPN domain
MKKDDFVYLRHIRDAIFRIEEYTKEVRYDDFMNINLVFGVDLDAIWETVERDIPSLKNTIKNLIEKEE